MCGVTEAKPNARFQYYKPKVYRKLSIHFGVGLPVYFLRPSHAYGIRLCLYLYVCDIMHSHSYVNVSPPCKPTRRAWTLRPVYDFNKCTTH